VAEHDRPDGAKIAVRVAQGPQFHRGLIAGPGFDRWSP
jgi:hypothetical protein